MKTKYPVWFAPHFVPNFNLKEPDKEVTLFTVLSSQRYDGTYQDITLTPEPNVSYRITTDSDGDENWLIIEKGTVAIQPNPKYEKELQVFNEKQKQNIEWKRLKALWDKEQEEEKEKKDRALYEKLKEKYGS